MKLFPIVLAFFIGACTRSLDLSDRPVVKVNDWQLTASRLSESLSAKLSDLPASAVKDEALVKATKERIINEFIIQSLTKDYAARNNIFLRPETIEAEINTIRSQYPNDLAFRSALASAGTTYKDWETKLRSTLLERQVNESLVKSMSRPKEEDVRKYYEQNKSNFEVLPKVRIRQIITETEEDAKKILKQISAGKKFKDLARVYSRGEEASAGGDIGWIERGVSEIYDYAFKLGPGQRSPIIKTPLGYLIYEVVDRSKPRTLTLIEAKKQIEAALIAESEQKLYSKWLETELLAAKVFKDEELIQAIQVQIRGAK